MSRGDRWLDLGETGVEPEDARRQERSAYELTERLTRLPGALLADEVGMGKTFVTFGHIALRAALDPGLRVLVVVPGSDLVDKWERDLMGFVEKPCVAERDLARRLTPRIAKRTDELVSIRGAGVTIATLASATGGGARTPDFDRAFLFEAALVGSGRWEKTRRQLARRFGIKALARRSAHDQAWLGYTLDRARPVARRALAAFLLNPDPDRDATRFSLALRSARRELIRRRLSKYDLLVLDEAHKLKNPASRRFVHLQEQLEGRFGTMLFLTATPFQIDLDELAAVFHLLCHATGSGTEALRTTCSAVLDHARRYRALFDELEQEWRYCPDADACLRKEPAGLADSQLRVRRAFERAVAERDALQGHLRQVMLREKKDVSYRREIRGSLDPKLPADVAQRRGAAITGGQRLPFAASVRLFHEMRRNKRPSFDPVVLQNLTSSYRAFRASSTTRRQRRGREQFYFDLINGLTRSGTHPKIAEVVRAVVDAHARGEKTLVFTGRSETARELAESVRRHLEADAASRFARIVGDEDRAKRRLASLQGEFTNRRSPLRLLWRDNLLHTWLPLVVDQAELRRLSTRRNLRPVIADALEAATAGRSKATARKRDVVTAARAVESYMVENAMMGDVERAYGRTLLVSYDEASSAWEDALGGEDGESSRGRKFDVDDLRRTLLSVGGIWARHGAQLRRLEPDLRAGVIAGVRSALLTTDAATQALVLSALERRGQRDRTEVLNRALATRAWEDVQGRIARFLALVLEHDSWQSRSWWIDAVATTRVPVTLLTGDMHDTQRTQHGRAFNSPFRPYVAIASEVSQEGIDLQRECSHVIHHDLSWNPATIEQRIGRVDRIHSKVSRDLETDRTAELVIGIPYIRGTIDERMWNIVSRRRAWFDICLGLEHDWSTGSLDDDAPPMPHEIADRLRIDLSLGGR